MLPRDEPLLRRIGRSRGGMAVEFFPDRFHCRIENERFLPFDDSFVRSAERVENVAEMIANDSVVGVHVRQRSPDIVERLFELAFSV